MIIRKELCATSNLRYFLPDNGHKVTAHKVTAHKEAIKPRVPNGEVEIIIARN